MPAGASHEDRPKPNGNGHAVGLTVREAICERLANGESLRAICRDDGMPAPSTVLFWRDTDEAFSEQYARAREIGYRLLADELIEIADNSKDDPQDRRVRIDTRKWMLSKMLPKVYGDKLELSGNDESPLAIAVVNYAGSAKADRPSE